MSESRATQDAMDKLFGVGEPRISIERPGGSGNAKPGRNEAYSRALLEARKVFPDDEIAQHRFADREAARVMRMLGNE